MLLAESFSDHPVTCRPPEITGVAPAAACHTTVCPLLPESAAPRASGADSRYVPPASCTTTSPVMLPSTASTAAFACVSEQGAAAEQEVPLPLGETYTVVMVAACDATAGAAMTPPAASAATSAALSGRPPAGRLRGVNIMDSSLSWG